MSLPSMIAVDGPAGAGKTTIGQAVAERLGYLFFDTGVMYRAVTLAVLRAKVSVDDEGSVVALARSLALEVLPPSVNDGRKCDVLIDGEDVSWAIFDPVVEEQVSQVSAYAGVREAMVAQQRRIGLRGKVVMVGRDIGTVVLPEAELKIYLDASDGERARRRFAELAGRGVGTTYEQVLEAMRRRDVIDSTRNVSPLKPASDAIIIHTDGLTAQQVIERIFASMADL